MNAFEAGRTVEARGMAILSPFLMENATGYVVIDKGPLAKTLQETVGDVIFNSKRNGQLYSAEIKVEEKNEYGNFFLETWSNRNLKDIGSYLERGNNPGWFIKSRSRLLLYYFLREDDLYIIDMFKLKQWAFCTEQGRSGWPLMRYPEKRQGKYDQLNDTWGCVAKIADVERQVGFGRFNPKAVVENLRSGKAA